MGLNYIQSGGSGGGGDDTPSLPSSTNVMSAAEPVVDTNNLPSGVSESDVETALSNMVADGVL